jgi:hypothetical protein
VSVFLFQLLVFPAAINMLQNYPSWQLEITLSTDSFQSSEMSTVVVLDPGGGTLVVMDDAAFGKLRFSVATALKTLRECNKQ